MNYLKFLFTKRIFSAVAVIIALILLTVGLPSNTGWHNLSEIENDKERFGFGLLIVAFIGGMLLQVNNEFQRGKK
jgi:hypothetical protein